MPKLKPLAQWFCDTCGKVIEKPEDGYFEYLRANNKYTRFRIVHHISALPEGTPYPGCQTDSRNVSLLDSSLGDFVGSYGQAQLLSMLDAGEIMDPGHKSPIEVVDIREWLIAYRRLQMPYYEEARLAFQAAIEDNFYDGWNEALPYSQENLLQVIKKYGSHG